MGKRECKIPKVTFIFTPGYEDRLTLGLLKIYEKRLQKAEEEKYRNATNKETTYQEY